VNAFLAAAIALLAATLPCLAVCVRGGHMDAVVGLEAAGSLVAVVLLLLAEGEGRAALFDLAMVLAALSLGSGLVFVRHLERGL
jgi:multisubunit Na+/H+ antiporter MnhF subunit